MAIKIIETTDLKAYKDVVEPLLLKKEACNNLSLGILDRLLQNQTEDIPYLGVVKDNDQVIYSFMQTPPNNLILPDIEGINLSIIKEIARFLHKQKVALPGVLGPDHLVTSFQEEWCQLTNCSSSIHMRQLIYQLDDVCEVKLADGYLVKASQEEKELISSWFVLFGQEANEAITEVQAEQMADRFLQNESVYLWKVEDIPVSMVNRSRKTKHGVTINGVYTPNEYKRKGYASAAVATLSKKLLKEGFQFCSLYTDLDNPTSNRIYQRIGYRVVGNSMVYHFDA